MQKHLLLLAGILGMGLTLTVPTPAQAYCSYYCGSNISEMQAYSPNYGGRHYYNDRYATPYLETRVRKTSPRYQGKTPYYTNRQSRYLESQVGDYSPRASRPSSGWSSTNKAKKSISGGQGWSWNPSTYLK